LLSELNRAVDVLAAASIINLRCDAVQSGR